MKGFVPRCNCCYLPTCKWHRFPLLSQSKAWWEGHLMILEEWQLMYWDIKEKEAVISECNCLNTSPSNLLPVIWRNFNLLLWVGEALQGIHFFSPLQYQIIMLLVHHPPLNGNAVFIAPADFWLQSCDLSGMAFTVLGWNSVVFTKKKRTATWKFCNTICLKLMALDDFCGWTEEKFGCYHLWLKRLIFSLQQTSRLHCNSRERVITDWEEAETVGACFFLYGAVISADAPREARMKHSCPKQPLRPASLQPHPRHQPASLFIPRRLAKRCDNCILLDATMWLWVQPLVFNKRKWSSAVMERYIFQWLPLSAH